MPSVKRLNSSIHADVSARLGYRQGNYWFSAGARAVTLI